MQEWAKMKLITAALTALAFLTTAAGSVNAASPALTVQVSAVTTQACHPLTSGGKCYEPGEYCRSTDHDVTGLAGDGKVIVCWDNDGWRWEPVTGVTLACTIRKGGPTGLEFGITADALSREYLGILTVSFGVDKPSGRVFPDRYVSPALPYRVWVDVPAADISGGTQPANCSVSV